MQDGEVDQHNARAHRQIVGEMALLKNASRSATVTAKTDCLLEPIDRERFEILIQDSPSFALYVMNVLADRMRLANDHLANNDLAN